MNTQPKLWNSETLSTLSSLTESIQNALRDIEDFESFDQTRENTQLDDMLNTSGLDLLVEDIELSLNDAEDPNVLLNVKATISDAIAAFKSGQANAVSWVHSHYKNDANGNDHTLVTWTFKSNNDVLTLGAICVEIRDIDGWDYEGSDYNDTASGLHLFNGDNITNKLGDIVVELLNSAAVAVVSNDIEFSPQITPERYEQAKTLLQRTSGIAELLTSSTLN